MFTGIVEEVGALVALTTLGDQGPDPDARLTVRGPLVRSSGSGSGRICGPRRRASPGS